MSYFEEPDWPFYCECRYDPVNDTMDREDCVLHFDLDELPLVQEAQQREYLKALKKPAAKAKNDSENAA